MNIETVKSLANILSAHGLTSLEVDGGGTKIRLKKEIHGAALQSVPVMTEIQAESVPSVTDIAEPAADDRTVDFNQLIEVKAPLVGVFYSAASPDSENFVSIGSKVKKGDVLCIIETMKLMNEVLAEQDGEIVDICAKSGDIAEFGQVLFKMF